MSSPEELRLPVGGGRELAGLAWGPRQGRPVLALHGWLDNAASFSRIAERLEGCRVVAIDFSGHGLSDPLPPGAAYHYVDLPLDVLAAADALGWHRFAILGHSMGAGVAPLVAAAAPERVIALALIEGLGPMSAEPDATAGRLRRYVAVRRGAPSRPAEYPDVQAAVRRLREAAPMDVSSAQILLARGTRTVGGGGVTWRSDPRLRWPSAVRMTEDQVLGVLRAVRAPTLLIRARDGYPLDQRRLRARCEAIADVRLVEVDGGHHVHLDHPEAVEGPLRAFLGDNAANGRDRLGTT